MMVAYAHVSTAIAALLTSMIGIFNLFTKRETTH